MSCLFYDRNPVRKILMNIGSWTHDAFVEAARNFHGAAAPGLIIGGYMVELARQHMSENAYDAISETDCCLPDAVQLLTPCTYGNGRLKVLPFGIHAISLYNRHTGEGVRVCIDDSRLDAFQDIRNWLAGSHPACTEASVSLLSQIREAGTEILSCRPITVRAEMRGRKADGAALRCPVCGDYHPVAFGGICRSCQGYSPYEERMSCSPGQPTLRAVPVEEAVGSHALHDMTRIVPGREKGAAFTAGQELSAGDICRLQQMGRNRIYVQEGNRELENWVHEDDVARTFARQMPGSGVEVEAPPREGKVNFRATRSGMLLVDTGRLERFNLVPDVMCATRHAYSLVEQGTRIAGTRAIPLYLSRSGLLKALAALEGGPLFQVKSLRRARVGILVTGTEVFQGLIQDRFAPIITGKVRHFHCDVVKTLVAPDDAAIISQSVRELLAAKADLVITTAGLSVDPDDVTRKGLSDAGLQDALYGVSALPGTMSLIGRINGENGSVQVLGVPACALFFKTTAFDLLLPRLLADVPVTRLDLARIGHGGLCMECRACVFPHCPFGRG